MATSAIIFDAMPKTKVVRMPSKRRSTKPRRSGPVFLTPDELLCVLRAAKEANVRDWAMILMGYLHGMRASEIAGLTRADVDFTRGCVRIRRLKGSLETTQPLFPHRGEPLLDEPKALRKWLAERPEDGSNFLFVSREGGRLCREQVHRIFKAAAERAGLPGEKRFVHILKHSRASHLVGKMDIALVRQTLGHKSLSSTMVYAHASDADAAREAQRVSMEIF